jgi:exopolysaccharide biosynthesis protein
MMMDDMGSIFAALGCQDAVNLDGGGSTQMLIRNPSDGSFKICNHPSDGSERAVIDAWAIVKNPQ